MNILPRDKQIAVISALSEGMSIRSVERLTGIHRDTIMRLGVRIGRGCAALHDKMMWDLQVSMIELDELWSYVGKKQRRIRPGDSADLGDQYVFIALGSLNKAILSYRVGKRNGENTEQFVADLRERVLGNPHINSDGWTAYEGAVTSEFRGSDYGQIIKSFQGEPPKDAARRYSPGWVVAVSRRAVAGRPREADISTSFVERSNLNVRMDCRRFTRLTNGYSKKLENHEAAVGLFIACYNLCRAHSTLSPKGAPKTTPAMALGVVDHVWSIGELIDAAEAADDEGKPFTPAPTSLPLPTPAHERPRFTVIQGGRLD
jgi:IS1 family transposase